MSILRSDTVQSAPDAAASAPNQNRAGLNIAAAQAELRRSLPQLVTMNEMAGGRILVIVPDDAPSGAAAQVRTTVRDLIEGGLMNEGHVEVLETTFD